MKKKEARLHANSGLVKLAAFGLSALLLFTGCGGKNHTASMDSGSAMATNGSAYKSGASSANYEKAEYAADELWSEGEAYEDYSEAVGERGTSSGESYSNTSASKRKLIKNVNMNVETLEYDTLMANLDTRVKELGGYIESLDSYNGSNYNYYDYYNSRNSGKQRRYANLTVRIPAAKLDDFVGSVAQLGNVVNKRESVEDVTLQYVDVQSHKESLQVEQKRLLELLERAEQLEDIITLENRLTNVRYQIESMESTLRTYDDLVDYSTVVLRIDEVEIFTPVVDEEEEKSAFEQMIEGFTESLIDVKDGIVDFCIGFVIRLPYLVVWGVIIFVIFLIIRGFVRRGSYKKQAKYEGIDWKEVRDRKKAEKAAKKAKKNESENSTVDGGNSENTEKTE